jgi:hypothetical protein
MKSRRISVLAMGILAGGLLMTGCGPTNAEDKGTTMSAEQIEESLRQKPSFEAAQAEYRSAVETMANQIAGLTPGTTWTFSDQTPWLSCGGDYIDTDAKHAYVSAGFEQAIPEAAWPQAVQIVKDGAAKFGATNLATFKDEPGNHDIAISGSDGVEFKLGTKVKASLTAQSDCRLSGKDSGTG